jgi:hypothetical protein
MVVVYSILVVGALASLFNALLQYNWYKRSGF